MAVLISPAASNIGKMSYRKQWYFQMVNGFPDITRATSCVLCMCVFVCDLCLYV